MASIHFTPLMLLLCFSAGALILVSFWRIYEKAGEPGWAVLVPIYNVIILLKIIGKPAWWVFLLLTPVNFVLIIIMIYLLAKSFGKDVEHAVGIVLFPYIFLPILAFGDIRYKGPAGEYVAPSSRPGARNPRNKPY